MFVSVLNVMTCIRVYVVEKQWFVVIMMSFLVVHYKGRNIAAQIDLLLYCTKICV